MMLVLEWAAAPILDLEWVGPSGDTIARAYSDPASVAAVVGPPGASAGASSISADAGNQLQVGTDGGVFMGPPALSSSQW